MLVVHPASTCDVCLEGYTSGSENIPYSISCGHVFCLSCLQSLRQHICPLCRSPFEASDVRRLHVDRNDQQLPGTTRTPSPRRMNDHRSELASDNALGLFDDVPRAVLLQNKITDLVLQSSFTSGVPERGVRELIQEVHTFLNSDPHERHLNLRAPFLLLYRFTELQGRYQQLESANSDLRLENNRDKQNIIDWERRYQDLQRSRTRDQETAKNVEASLRERLRIEELEWQRKYDFVAEECAMLRDEADKLRFSSSKLRNPLPPPPRSTPSTQVYFLAVEDSMRMTRRQDDGDYKVSANEKETEFSNEQDDMYSLFNPELFHISPIPERITLRDVKRGSDSDDESTIEKQKQKQRSHVPRSPTGSLSGSVSRASDSAAALKLSPNMKAAPIYAMPNRQRSGSSPYRPVARDASRSPKEREAEASSSAPSSYMYQDDFQTRSLFPPTPRPLQTAESSPDKRSPEVMRLYSLLEKPAQMTEPRFDIGSNSLNKTKSSGHEETPRPTLLRSSSFHQPRTSSHSASSTSAMSALPPLPTSQPAYFRPYALRQAQGAHTQQPSLLSTSQPRLNLQTQTPSNQNQNQPQNQNQDQMLSPIQKTPPRPVLPHMHSFAYYTPPKPVSPQETRMAARGSLPRRGSLSSASAAAAGQSQAGPREREAKNPALVPASSLWLGKPHAGGLRESRSRESD